MHELTLSSKWHKQKVSEARGKWKIRSEMGRIETGGQSPGCKESGCSGFHVLTMIKRSDRQNVPISPDSPKADGRGEAVCCGEGEGGLPRSQ